MFNKIRHLNRMQTFTVMWFGQLVSMLGTAMTRFALLIWAYQQTGSATTLALLGFFSFILFVILSPIAGVLVDRWDRRRVMILTDLGAGLMTLMMLILYSTGNLEIWHIYIAEALSGAFEAFQVPAYTTSVSTLVPKERYARANGMRSLSQGISEVLAPVFAGLVLRMVDIDGVMFIDLVTFGIAMYSLLVVRIPRPAQTADGVAARGNVHHEIAFGFRYIFQRPGLLGLLFIFVGINLFAALTYYGVMPAMILARTGGDELALATVQGALGIAGIIGGVVVTVVGLPKRRIHAALGFTAVSFITGDFLFAVGRTVPAWTIAALTGAFFIPFITSGQRTIWQTKVAPDIQGRVFAVENMLRTAMLPIGYLLAGPLADRVFEPAMSIGGSLSGTLGWLVGTGPGAGMALMFVCTSIGGMLVSASGYFFRAVRCVEDDLPDHDTAGLAEIAPELAEAPV
jgi:MFS family permease